MRIGVFDSGIGGLTILKRLIDNCPNHEYIYFGDTLNMPYGEKTKDELIECGNKVIKFLESMNVDLIIIACGTLSNNIKYLNSNKRLISLVSLLDNKLDNYKCVSVIATPLSIKTNIYKEYIHTNLELIPCHDLASSIEHNDYKKIDKLLKKYLNNVSGDALLLGCTHYGIVKNDINKYYKGDIIGLDDFICDEIKKEKDSVFKLELYFSKIDDNLRKNVENILVINNLKLESRVL